MSLPFVSRKPVDAQGAFREALRFMAWLLAGLLVVGVVVGALVAGVSGVVAAVLAVLLAAVFSGTTVLSMLRTGDADPARFMGVVMGMWLVKMLIVFVAVIVVGQIDYFGSAARLVLGVLLLVGVLGSAVLDYVAVSRARVPYISPATDENSPAQDESHAPDGESSPGDRLG
jgi:hypothetical protein